MTTTPHTHTPAPTPSAQEVEAMRHCLDCADSRADEYGETMRGNTLRDALRGYLARVDAAAAQPPAAADGGVLLDRLRLLATRVRETYGRAVLRSCGLDDMMGRGIVLADCEPREFEAGTRLPPARPAPPVEVRGEVGDAAGAGEGGRA